MLFIVLIFIIFSLFLYYLSTNNYDYFKKQSVPFEKPFPIIGNQWRLFSGKINQYQFFDRFYKMFKPAGIGGIFQMTQPAYLIADPELLKNITIKDFEHFINHFNFNPQDQMISKTLLALRDTKWKNVRATLSPAFTGNKMRIMFELIEKCVFKLEKFIYNECHNGKVFKQEVKNLINRFTNDAIATTAFGMEVDAVNSVDNEFYMMGKDLLDFTSGLRWLKFPLGFLSPFLMRLIFPEGILSPKAVNFFKNIFTDNITTRREKGIIRPDMIHLMLEATKEEREKRKHETEEVLTDDEMLAQALIFFVGGFDTISTTLTFALHHLGAYPGIQEKLYLEIKKTLEENNRKINYEILNKMNYLEMFLSESQRYQPVFPLIDRECSKRYTIPSNGVRPEVTIEPGAFLLICPYGFHHDPEYFPDPEKFIPERFSEENKSKINPYAYLPFGIGPRSCIANRFAKMEVKLVLFHLLKSFEVVFVEETEHPIKLSAKGTGNTSDKGFWLGFKLRKPI